MGSLARKLRRNKAKKEFKEKGNGLTLGDYCRMKEGKPLKGQYKEAAPVQQVSTANPPDYSQMPTATLNEEQERERQRQESINTGKAFLKGLDIFNKKVEDLKANDEHGEHN